MKYVIVVMVALIISLSASTEYFRRLHAEAIGYIGVCTESLSNTSVALQICQFDARLNDLLGVQLENEIQESVSVYDEYLTKIKDIPKSSKLTHTDTTQIKKEKRSVNNEQEATLSDTLPSNVSGLLNEAYDKLYPSSERDAKDIHKQ